MSQFGPQILPIEAIIPIEGADAIEIAQILGYQAVVQKGIYSAGQEILYIPEGYVVPERLIKHLGLEGRLHGSHKNRVKAIKLRKVLSQGLVCYVQRLGHVVDSMADTHPNSYVIMWNQEEGAYFINDNVAEILGIIKYEAPIPGSLAGQCRTLRVPEGGSNVGSELTVKYDIENIKSYKNVLQEGEEVVITEKLHGTCFAVAHVPGLNQDDLFFDGNTFCYSKGLGARGIVFFDTEKNRAENTYVKMMLEHETRIRATLVGTGDHQDAMPIYVFGEILGEGIQDLGYGATKPIWRIFDAHIGYRNAPDSRWMNWDEVEELAATLHVPTVPVLYRGPWNEEVHAQYRDGATTMNGASHIREGIVIKPVIDRAVRGLGRVILKSVSPNYLTRKGGTEHN